MFRYVLSLTFAVGLASAATIITTARCSGPNTFGTFFASCNDAFAQAEARIEIGGTFSVSASASTIDFGGTVPEATANFSDDYVFTLFGGTGNGFFLPCFSGGGLRDADMSFGGIDWDVRFSATNCAIPLTYLFGMSRPFTFGVPQIDHVTMFADAVQPCRFCFGMVSESLDHFLFFDPAGNPLSNVTFTLVEVPEPAAWSLLGVGGMFFLVVAVSSLTLEQWIGEFNRLKKVNDEMLAGNLPKKKAANPKSTGTKQLKSRA
jgi:hypothetical protein